MKYLILLMLFIASCTKAPKEEFFDLAACNRDRCVELVRFISEDECFRLSNSIIALHRLRNDKPKAVLACLSERTQ